MSVEVPIESMSTAEKLQLMETLWASLARNPENVPSPNWHGAVLDQRRQAVIDGRTSFEDWDDVKKRLQSRFK